MPAGLNGSASKPLPGSGHITGGVHSVSDDSRRCVSSSPFVAVIFLGYGDLGGPDVAVFKGSDVEIW